MEKQPDRPSRLHTGVDYQAKYEALLAACGNANGEKEVLLTQVSGHVKALLTVICYPDPPGCNGPIPSGNEMALLQACQDANANKKQQLQTIDHEIDALMKIICEPNPPGCNP